jgi:hypothetical protein
VRLGSLRKRARALLAEGVPERVVAIPEVARLRVSAEQQFDTGGHGIEQP